MNERYRLFLRRKSVYYAFDNTTKTFQSLKTHDRAEGARLLLALNEAGKQLAVNLGLARVYLKHSDPLVAQRTWQHVLEEIIKLKEGPTQYRWQTASRDKAFDLIRSRLLIETQAEHFLEVLKKGTVSTNAYLVKPHNLALDMNWLTATIIHPERIKVCQLRWRLVAIFVVSVLRALPHDGCMTYETSRVIDLRSDTVTKPTPAMREAMARAEVGDDVFGDDPTVQELESETAALLGKEAAMFTPSGTMANQLAIRSQTEPGDEILVDANAHIYYYEGGAPAALSGVMCRCLDGWRGVFTDADLEAALRPTDQHFPRTRLVCIENTHNRGGGKIWPIEQIREVAAAALKHGLQLHLDGARLWNASVATGIAEREYAAPFNTVSVCFSKGLGAPVGSALAGSKNLIERARRFRKMIGGGMRQAGVIAAGALFALRNHRGRLVEDHANAKLLASRLGNIQGLKVEPDEVETNMIRFRVRVMPAEQLVERLRARGVLVLAVGRDTIRAVSNLMVSAQDIEAAVGTISALLK